MTLKVVLPEIGIQLMPPGFDPGGFDCGKPDMNEYLTDGSARDDAKANYSRTYVAHHEGHFVGYVSLLTDAIRLTTRERKPTGVRYPSAPAVKIGRLARCLSVRKQGVGFHLLQFAIGKARVEIVEGFGCRWLTLDSHLDKVDWYAKKGFSRNDAERIAAKNRRYEHNKTSLDKPLATVSMRFDLYVPELGS